MLWAQEKDITNDWVQNEHYSGEWNLTYVPSPPPPVSYLDIYLKFHIKINVYN